MVAEPARGPRLRRGACSNRRRRDKAETRLAPVVAGAASGWTQPRWGCGGDDDVTRGFANPGLNFGTPLAFGWHQAQRAFVFQPGVGTTSVPGIPQSFRVVNPAGVASIAVIPHHAAMPQSLSRVILHSVFSTKERFPCFEDKTFRAEVHAHLGGCAKSLDCLPIQIGGVSDHVHLLTTLPRELCIADFIKEVRRVSTNWIQERGAGWAQFHWQADTPLSRFESSVPKAVRDIEDQEEHHRATNFQEEYRALLRKHGQKWDEAYVWD
jgi:putative transposase